MKLTVTKLFGNLLWNGTSAGVTMYGACYWCQLWRKSPEAKSARVGALNKFTFGSGL